jgi:3-hydroxyisobutyrate dehydrogenase-like beta-hydroxyacid dehydrogenase
MSRPISLGIIGLGAMGTEMQRRLPRVAIEPARPGLEPAIAEERR